MDGLSGNTATFSFPVKRSYEPNVYVCAMLVRKASSLAPGEPGRALGAVSLNVARESNRIPVALFLPGTMRPDGPLEIEVTAEPGAEITIAAVDEGIHQLTTAKGPDPFAFFYAKRALMTKWYDIFAMLLPEVADRIAPPGGGQGMRDMAQFLRSEPLRRTRPLSFWSGVLSAGADGKVRWSVDIPDFNGAVRVTAVAVKDKRFGKAASLTRVRSPLILTPTFPRFLSLDEEFLVPVTLRNDVETGDGEPEFTVELGARGPVLVQDPARKVTVPRGREQTVWFRAATMDRVGEARFTVRAEGAGERAESQAVIGLRAPLPPIRFLEQGSLEEAEQSFALDPPRTLVNGTLARDFRVGSLPMIRFSGRLSELLRYPFGCAEQAVSRAFPLVRFADLARVLDPSLFDETTPQAMVQSAITRLRTMQTQDGGFSMWPGGSESAPWISVYAAHFLAEARAAGYSTAGGTLDNALGYVSWQVRVGQDASGPEIERAAYAAFVLAFAGRPDRGAMDFLNQQLRDKLDSEAALFLGAAYALSGDPATYQELSALAEQKADKPEEEATFGPNLDSPVRSPALRLTALLAADPGAEAVPRLVEELSRLLSEPGALSTQEAGFALTALGGFFARQQKAGPLAGKVLLGQDLLGSFDQDTPLAVTGVESEKPLRVEVTEGFANARVFWSLTTRGAPEAGDYEPESSGLEVKREVFDRNGRPLENGEVLQGDLLAVRTRLRSTKDAVSDVVVQELLPVGLEVENPGLASSETLYWMEGDPLLGGRTDLRDDRVVLFTDLPDTDWRSSWTLLRAVTCGNFTWPPVQAEAMYRPSVRASGKLGGLQVIRRR